MIDAEPETINAEPGDLRSLANALTGFSLSDDHGRISGVWLWRGDQTALFLTSDSRDIVFKFEVFTLAIRAVGHTISPAQMAEAAARAIAWPFTNWRVDVLWIRDWSTSIEALPDGWYGSADARRFGTVPDGADHACLVPKGLLFTGIDGTRMIIDQGEMPLDLSVTCDPESIDQAIIGTMAVTLDEYLTGVLPSLGTDGA